MCAFRTWGPPRRKAIGKRSRYRVRLIHRNVPGILAGITQAATAAKLNIENMANKSKGQWAYTMLDLSGPADEQMARGIAQLPDVVRVRVV